MIRAGLAALITRVAGAALAACLALAPAGVFAQAPDGLVEGRDYVAIPGGRPLHAAPGKVEVVEVFGYWCPVCNDFEPRLSAWKRALPDDVVFRYLPGAYSRDDVYARAYFAVESLGALARTHDATYRAIHVEHLLPQRGATVDEIAGHIGSLGVKGADHAAVAAAMRSPAVDARMDDARAFIVGAGVEGVPSIIVNGRYRVLGRGFGDLLRNTDLLVARERAAAGTASRTSPPDESAP